MGWVVERLLEVSLEACEGEMIESRPSQTSPFTRLHCVLCTSLAYSYICISGSKTQCKKTIIIHDAEPPHCSAKSCTIMFSSCLEMLQVHVGLFKEQSFLILPPTSVLAPVCVFVCFGNCMHKVI
eukprot:scpid83332/ scgid6562/ 